MKAVLAICAALPLAACATVPAQDELPPPRDPGSCDAAAVQSHIGHEATSEMGAAILAESGARTLRWGPPESAWTMDYRTDRVNVRYDRDMKITAITCG
ncbi:I78 family peptidase inhibitor [Qipengyuania seohaensis]|uniref:I78 family peptidase inhibitor n=1 Tax=Qipengyuania seohaensis TaxID=266951 RepID=UPI000C229FCF|nr:I78 family peptidase inhibitor [Qipengyuania seohaensis]